MNNATEAGPPKARRPNKRQAWVDAIEFVLAESARFQVMLSDAMRDGTLSSLPRDDFLFELKGVDGRVFTYGRKAQIALEDAAEDALHRSRFSGTVGFDRFMKVLKPAIVESFIVKGHEVALSSVDSVFAKALTEAASARVDSRHLIPCQLMFQAEPESFSIGPVTFYNRDSFAPIADELVKEHRAEAVRSGGATVVDKVLDYFAKFTWVADLTIVGCDPEMGRERALQAAGAAVDFMHVLFGHHHSRNMVVGGPGLDSDVRAEFEVRDGETFLTYSIGSTSAMGFPKDWSSMLGKMGPRTLVKAAGRAIEALTDPSKTRPLALRFIDAASWHGQAVRETSDAASIVKSVTALERLVTVEKSSNTTRIVTERNAALAYDPAREERFGQVVARMESIYDLRSRLAHGTLSPFDAEVRNRRNQVLTAAQKALVNGLNLFDQNDLFDRPQTKRELTEGLEHLVSWSRDADARRWANGDR